MNFYPLCVVILFSLILFGCKPEPRETINIEQLPIPEVEEINRISKVGAPLVIYKKAKAHIYHLTRNTSFELKKSISTHREAEDIEVEVFSNELFQFKVPIRKEHSVPEWKYEGIDTLVAISDVEGNYRAMVSWLKGNHIISEDFKWSFGDNHLVINGDMMDRGDQVFQLLWLIYKLEPEAEEQGGKVHFVLGNHEQLNIQGYYDKKNLQYVHPQYFNDASVLDIDYSEWLSDKTELGRWIRTKNAIMQINTELFVHGGISTKLLESEMTIQEINDVNRSTMNIASKQYDSSQTLIGLGDGPLWYRGLADEDLDEEQVLGILDDYNCKRIIIGHTIVHEDKIEPLYNGSVIPIDLHLEKTFKKGIAKGIMITEDGLYELDNKRNKRSIDRIEI